jgi:hypothetical protein
MGSKKPRPMFLASPLRSRMSVNSFAQFASGLNSISATRTLTACALISAGMRERAGTLTSRKRRTSNCLMTFSDGSRPVDGNKASRDPGSSLYNLLVFTIADSRGEARTQFFSSFLMSLLPKLAGKDCSRSSPDQCAVGQADKIG